MPWIDFQRLLKIADGVVNAIFPRRYDSEVVPCVGNSVRISRLQLHTSLKHFAGSGIPVLVQINASDAVDRLSTCGIAAQSLLEGGCSLIQISTLKEQGSGREMVASE